MESLLDEIKVCLLKRISSQGKIPKSLTALTRGICKSTITAITASTYLNKKGLITKKRKGRQLCLRVTEKGRRVLELLLNIERELNEI